MNAPAVAADQAMDTDGWRNFSVTMLLLTIGLVGLGLVFRAEVVAAVSTWEVSTAYNHCFLIIPISIYMIWDRRDVLHGLRAMPLPIAALAGLGPAVGWLLAERLGIMEGRQLMVVAFAQVLFLAILGWRLWWALSGPLLYLFFLVPFGEFLVPRLQDITAVFIRFGLGLTTIPAYIDGYTIEIPAGTFYVAEACAGLRFLIASIAFGVLYALMMYRSPTRRAVFIIISIVVPIVANGFRALGIVVLGHLLGSADAAAADHILYGWIFFSIVILLLTVIGLPFREDLIRETPPEPDRDPGMLALAPGITAVVAALVVAAISPGVVLALERIGAARTVAPIALKAPENCEVLTQGGAEPRSGGGRVLPELVRCGNMEFEVVIEAFSAHTTSGPIMNERRRLARPRGSENIVEVPVLGADGKDTKLRVVRGTEPHFLAATGVWIDGAPSNTGLMMRIHQARASLLGAAYAPVLMVVLPRVDLDRASPEQRREIEQQLTAFVLAQPDLDAQIRAMARLPD